MNTLDPRFIHGYDAIKSLAAWPRYEAAFIFGSVAEGTSNIHSDLDVKVVVDEDVVCENVNHPAIDDYKLDISFRSLSQIDKCTKDELRSGEREPNLARAMIVFDKTGRLTALQTEVRGTQPKKYTPKDHQWVQFMLYHADNKVKRSLDSDPPAALYSMHANIGEVLKIYFRLHGRWWVSSKKVLDNLETWDRELAGLVKSFVVAAKPREKFIHWTAIIDHVTRPMGGRLAIAENTCRCKICRADLARLSGN